MTENLTWTNPVMEVKIMFGNFGLILSGYAIKINLMHGCSFYYWSRVLKSLFPKKCNSCGQT